MQNLMQCKQCSGVDFEKISDHFFRCKHCGATYMPDSRPPSAHPSDGIPRPPPASPISASSPRARIAILVSMAVAGAIIAGATALIVLTRSSRMPNGNRNSSSQNEKPEALSEYGSEAIQDQPKPEGSFTRIAEIPDSIGNVYFMGIYKNTGKSAMQKPMVTIVLYSASDRKIASGRGYAIRETLLPGEETPIIVLVSDPPKYSRFEVENEPAAPYEFMDQERMKMSFRNVLMKKGRYSGYEIGGEIVNESDREGRFVNVIGLLLDSQNRIIGGGTGYIGEQTLGSGDYAAFKIDVTTVKGIPASFILDYSGTPAK